MDPQTHFFDDCVNLDDDPNPFAGTPDREMRDVAGEMPGFSYYATRSGLNDTPLTFPVKTEDMDVGVWDRLPQAADGGEAEADQRPLFADSAESYGQDEDDDGQDQEVGVEDEVEVAFTSRPSTRRASSSQRTTNSSTDITPPEDQEPPKKRKSRKTRKEANTAEEEEKRNKFLERNRVAASKCREKKKLYVSNLEETKLNLENKHAHLQLEYQGLVAEISGLKNHLMIHAKCNDPNIDRWLNNEARRYVQTSSELFGPSFAGFAPDMTPAQQPSHRRTSSTVSAYPSGMALSGLHGAPERRSSIALSSILPPNLPHRLGVPEPRISALEEGTGHQL